MCIDVRKTDKLADHGGSIDDCNISRVVHTQVLKKVSQRRKSIRLVDSALKSIDTYRPSKFGPHSCFDSIEEFDPRSHRTRSPRSNGVDRSTRIDFDFRWLADMGLGTSLCTWFIDTKALCLHTLKSLNGRLTLVVDTLRTSGTQSSTCQCKTSTE